jgi:hypothetical protein
MKKTCRGPIRNAAVCLTAAISLVILITALSQPAPALEQTQPQPQQTTVHNRGPNPLVQFGQFPPDFELPILTFGTDTAGKSVGKIDPKKTIRLSDYRGKKPVCLIMSSYT